MRLTAVRITCIIIRLVDGAPIKLALECDSRNAGRDLIPQCKALSVAREVGQRWLPYRWEVTDVMDNGRVSICSALGIRI